MAISNFFKKKEKQTSSKAANYSSVLDEVYTRVQNLRIGMYVCKLDRPWTETSFKFQGFLIETEQELQILRNTCEHVFIDITKQKKHLSDLRPNKIKKNTDKKKLKISEPGQKLGSFEKEFSRAEKTYQDSKVFVSDLMDKVANGEGVDTAIAKDAISTCVNSVMHSPDAFLWLSQLKEKDTYTTQHSMNVCILSIILGHQIGLKTEQLNRVAMCGMMHDMGKMLVPLGMLNKPGKLDPAEWRVMQKHTILGYELLSSSPNMFQGAIETALYHHERLDSKGYPRGISSSSLSYYSNIVAIADIYDAITSDRVYQKASTHLEAIKVLFELSGTQLNKQLVVKFIESLSVYPPGSFVKMSNGSIAMVLEVNNTLKLRPKIMLILDKNKQLLGDIMVDLTKTMTDFAGKPLSISGIIKPDDYQISAKNYYDKSIIENSFAQYSPKKTGLFHR
ncbi:MAG: HD-GYP domain-containing protein [Methyloprofundus sp.]|nr:HD-GYP domain-containing protein [Methyloprofundus sp.]